MQCIQSAEIVLEVRNLVIGKKSVGSFTYIFLAHFFMAAVILAMDMCFNPTEIQVEQRKKDVLRACRVLEEELSAKMEPVDELGNEGDSNGHLKLRAFQKALQNLRGLLRRTNGKEKLQQVESVSGIVGQNEGLTGGHSTNGMPMMPKRQTDGGQPKTTNSGNYPLQSGNYSAIIESIPQFSAGTNTPPSAAIPRAPKHTRLRIRRHLGKNSSASDPISTAQAGTHFSLISMGRWAGMGSGT
ncbi:uncharacterized protein K444DRAFT_16181 [Hyaloscypha bicolor E]|uniref:Uncharacterized protein n=1 Tax=Hyaloscypha bicolor E TaxID=1095630 RepID=A0A2J6TWQ8_9HELO|nr:uncharacterized protein K444DRAFT_16181 [Hyaloscypha bicolor E]PMD67460.1 hypothetical protein K444DRAFT_16181 [Hyaloscypha bicolor E]